MFGASGAVGLSASAKSGVREERDESVASEEAEAVAEAVGAVLDSAVAEAVEEVLDSAVAEPAGSFWAIILPFRCQLTSFV